MSHQITIAQQFNIHRILTEKIPAFNSSYLDYRQQTSMPAIQLQSRDSVGRRLHEKSKIQCKSINRRRLL